MTEQNKPRGELSIRTIAMPADTNHNGDIFGGWLLCQMDLAGYRIACKQAHSRITTVAIDSLSFRCPVSVGDSVCCYCEIIDIGRTSLKIRIETWALSLENDDHRRKVTEGIFTYVAIDEYGKPQPVNS